MSAFDDDDIPLAVVKAKAVSSATNAATNGKSKAPASGKAEAKKIVSTEVKENKSIVASKSSGKDSPVPARESKKEVKELKKAKSSSEWADVDNYALSYSSKKPKSWFEWARANTPLVIFLGLVVIIVSCRIAEEYAPERWHSLKDQEDPFLTLELPKTASDAEIRSAYRKLSLKLHPDKNP
eukprot:CAMPEP_0172213940 /NCGR_PEP_ID=MMETSP1050-20130122/37879_1 /TAXON_ID=233186 /ORGANISM="Cryptomonas curvata, Strain CCAP979/52" /LENGTH=181 /DNA_ID=CAMNT_0012894843 /DNA_START=104 /DNA_END=645 /DNA_ORIENTATION=+